MPVVVGRIAAHTPGLTGVWTAITQLQYVITEPFAMRVEMQVPALALESEAATPARIAIAKTNLTIPNTPSYRAGLP
jgi:hypothetical protein